MYDLFDKSIYLLFWHNTGIRHHTVNMNAFVLGFFFFLFINALCSVYLWYSVKYISIVFNYHCKRPKTFAGLLVLSISFFFFLEEGAGGHLQVLTYVISNRLLMQTFCSPNIVAEFAMSFFRTAACKFTIFLNFNSIRSPKDIEKKFKTYLAVCNLKLLF